MTLSKTIALAVLALIAGAAQAQINVVATTSNMGMLVDTVGGDAVTTQVLAPPDRDAHHLSVRPAMMAAVRRADLVVAVGAELEIGWLPPVIQGAGNRNVNPGRTGYFEAAAHVELTGTDVPADRSLGDVHPAGNPHIYLDPIRMGEVANALAERLASFAPEHGDTFRANAKRFNAEAKSRVEQWLGRVDGAPGVVLFHDDAGYLLGRLGVPTLGALEPVPGVPPNPSHLRNLVRRLEGERGFVAYYPYHPSRPAEFVADQLGWQAVSLSTHAPLNSGADGYFAMLERWIRSIEESRG